MGHPEFARVSCAPDAGPTDAGADDSDAELDATPLDAATDGATTQRYFFEVEIGSVQLGARRADWPSGTYGAGLNQDCADRLDGAACTPAAIPIYPFPTLANGIENAFATQLLAPMRDELDAGDVEDRVKLWMSAGLGGLFIVVDGWNGLAEDDRVQVQIDNVRPGASGTSIDPSNPVSENAYVAGGQLIATFGSRLEQQIVLGNQSKALVTVRVKGAMVVGTLSSASIERFIIAGYIGSGGQAGPDFDQNLAELVLSCGDPGLLSAANRAAVLRLAASDLRDPLGGSTCSRMSFGLAARAVIRATPPPLETPASARVSCQ